VTQGERDEERRNGEMRRERLCERETR